ncbi:HVO_0476 family zinc finger protein [Methanotorris formicicus]|uniref:Uncharacterized protein n=1 Tax=Methanotorris formicicus Mc-S-70 TaxID=647171 RepID=H1L1M0_9EURY|nr:HVO_0476 family zinc finger protein [Methanotorris formicicus]EHP83614.1 hypothetical protein MetfoDRAFT_1944 [Methanotorris formicicus Mc-S-70]
MEYFECPVCGDLTPHEILKSKESKKYAKYVVKCLECNTIHEVEFSVKLKDISVIISRFDESERKVVQLPMGEVVEVGEELEVDGERIEVTTIDTDDGKRVSSSKVDDIKTIWAKSLDIPKKLGISINDGKKTYSVYIFVPMDYVFEVDNVYRIKNGFFRIKLIKTEKGNAKKDVAKNIKRMYANLIKPTRRYIDLTKYLPDIEE